MKTSPRRKRGKVLPAVVLAAGLGIGCDEDLDFDGEAPPARRGESGVRMLEVLG